MDIILIRHARPAMAAGLCYGRTDLPLDEPMDPDAASIADKLAAHPPQRLLASPLQRSVLTAQRWRGRRACRCPSWMPAW